MNYLISLEGLIGDEGANVDIRHARFAYWGADGIVYAFDNKHSTLRMVHVYDVHQGAYEVSDMPFPDIDDRADWQAIKRALPCVPDEATRPPQDGYYLFNPPLVGKTYWDCFIGWHPLTHEHVMQTW